MLFIERVVFKTHSFQEINSIFLWFIFYFLGTAIQIFTLLVLSSPVFTICIIMKTELLKKKKGINNEFWNLTFLNSHEVPVINYFFSTFCNK